MDFMQDALADGRTLRILTVIDRYTREALTIEVDTSIPGLRVRHVLERLADRNVVAFGYFPGARQFAHHTRGFPL